jgi:hypothetical protein
MCPVCKTKPSKAGHSGYCNDCENKYQRERYHSQKQSRGIGSWRRRGEKKPPTDWREVLRKAEEQKP